MTPTSLALAGLRYCYPSGSPTNTATLANASAPQKEDLAECITAAVQELWDLCEFPRSTRGFNLLAPRAITLTVTDNSATVTTGDTFTEGATVYVGGIFNQIYTEGATKKLIYPFSGATGAVPATLYGDVMVLAATDSEVRNQVHHADGRPLTPVTNIEDLRRPRYFPDSDYGRGSLLPTLAPTIGNPDKYLAENFILTDGTNQTLARRVRVHPLPVALTQISILVTVRAPFFASTDLGSDGSPSTRTFLVPDNYHERFLKPIFLEKWASSPWFRDDAARRGIADNAAAARRALSEKRLQTAHPLVMVPGL